MHTLSNPAKALLGCLWINPKFTLRFGMVESVPSPQAEAALSELVAAGILTRAEDHSGGVTFALTDAGGSIDRKPKGGMAFIGKYGSFPLSQPRSTP